MQFRSILKLPHHFLWSIQCLINITRTVLESVAIKINCLFNNIQDDSFRGLFMDNGQRVTRVAGVKRFPDLKFVTPIPQL